MSCTLCENRSTLTPILKNARRRITYCAKKMMKRWYRDWEHCRHQWMRTSGDQVLEGHSLLENSLLADECRMLHQEQCVLDALDETLAGATLNTSRKIFPCGLPASWDHNAICCDPALSDTLFSRSGGFVRYRS
jgi:hypothetical protein